MTAFRADLHIHSRFSRATSSRLTVPHLAAWAGVKGIDVLATGDFTHPAWRAELRSALVPDEASGLYRLRQPLTANDLEREIPQLAGAELTPGDPRFILQAEISSIYKKNGAVRKIHSLVYVPDFDAADALCARLEAIGNLASDGRPILGLDARHLLDMVLAIPRARLIPAHIWTPWFSLFGSRSGFNSVEECFEDLSPHIFALETGLSSDPDMNRRWSRLDKFALVSNSDAHSGENLGREATLFSGAPSYDGMFAALEQHGEPAGVNYAGTLEFFPEEGKYHLDGHRDCGVVLEPKETRRLNGICPVCGKPLTVGVLHRVVELADRAEAPHTGEGFFSLVPLAEILGELLHCGPKTKKPQQKYADLARRFGPELTLLLDTPLDDVSRHWPELGEALARMRAGRVIRTGGYDGEYGVIRLFEPGENRPSLLASAPRAARRPRAAALLPPPAKAGTPAPPAAFTLTPAQEAAAAARPDPVLVLAGPGSGKTRTLAGRVVRLLEAGTPATDIVAVTFTRRAAGELRERLAAASGGVAPEADTLHALALKYAYGAPGEAAPAILGEQAARRAFGVASGLPEKTARETWNAYALGRERLDIPASAREAGALYAAWKRERGLADYADLPEAWLRALRAGAPRPWKHVLVDEAQDLSPMQRALVAALLPPDGAGFFGIGDPDQSIYSFRGADANVASTLRVVWPSLRTLSLGESHRAPQAILQAARAALGRAAAGAPLSAASPRPATLQWLAAPTAEREAAWVADRIAWLVGGTSHQQADTREERAGCHLGAGSCSPGDIAVLVRLKALMPPLRAALEQRGIPCAVPESEAFWEDAEVDVLLGGAAIIAQGAPEAMGFPAAVWNNGPAAVRANADVPPSAAFLALEAAFRTLGGWRPLLDNVALRREIDMVRQRAERVQIMTLHAAKGLEFKTVFLPCLEDGLLPFRGTNALLTGAAADDAFAEAEERRLLYVGLTRASEAVFASFAAQRTLYGRQLRLFPSPFVPERLFHAVSLIRKTRVSSSQLSLM